MIARVLSSTQGANNTMMLTSLMTLPCTQECVIVKQVIVNFRNVTRHRNGQSVKSSQYVNISSTEFGASFYIAFNDQLVL